MVPCGIGATACFCSPSVLGTSPCPLFLFATQPNACPPPNDWIRTSPHLKEGMRDNEHEGGADLSMGGHAGSGLRRSPAGGGEEETEGRGEGSGSPLLKAILQNFRDPCLDKMLERLDSVLTESTSYSRNSAMMRHQVWPIFRTCGWERERAGSIGSYFLR